jgi:hypothetical protein
MQSDIVTRLEEKEPTRIIVKEEIADLFNEVKEYMENEVITRLEDREPLKIIIKDNASRMANEFKDNMQNLEIVTNFELTETIIQENFKQLFERLTDENTYNVDNFNLIQTDLKALPSFRDMENFFSKIIKTDEVIKQFDA